MYYGAMNPVTFNASAGDQNTFRVSSSSANPNFQCELYDPSGNLITPATSSSNGWVRLDSFTIVQSGLYTLLYMERDGRQILESFGTSLQRRTNPPNNPSVLTGNQVLLTQFNKLGEITPYVFTAKSGDDFTVTMDNNFSSISPRMELYGPNGVLLRAGNATNTLSFPTLRLSQTGQFTLWAMDNNGRFSGGYRLNTRLVRVGTYDVPEVKAMTLTPNPATTTCQIEFEAQSGEKADLTIQTSTGVVVYVEHDVVCQGGKNTLASDF